jgi:hypothetical protein
MGSGSRWRLGRVLVVVDVGFPHVLLSFVYMGVVDMGERRVVVLVVVRRRQVRPLLALDHVVGDVEVLVLVHLGVMAVLLLGHCRLPSYARPPPQ